MNRAPNSQGGRRPLRSRRPQKDGPTSRCKNRPVRLVTNDIILLRLPHDGSTRTLQECSKTPGKAVPQSTMCFKVHTFVLCHDIIESLPVPVSSFPFPPITLIRAPALATGSVPLIALAYNP